MGKKHKKRGKKHPTNATDTAEEASCGASVNKVTVLIENNTGDAEKE